MSTLVQESLNLDGSTTEDTPLSVLHADDIITLDAALFYCPVRTLPLNTFGISVYLAEITPQVASLMLSRKNTNRSIKLTQLNRIKRTLEKMRWEINGETIIYDHEGRLLEGQHRLQAAVDTNKTFWTLIVRGINRERFKTMGQGSKRTAGDILGIQGVKNATNIAAALRWVYRYETDQMTNAHPNITDDELTDTLPAHMEILQSIPFGKKCQGIAAPGMATALHYLCRLGRKRAGRRKATGVAGHAMRKAAMGSWRPPQTQGPRRSLFLESRERRKS